MGGVIAPAQFTTAPQLQASTGAAGFALQNGTPTILSWTAPNDGQLHRATLIAGQHVTSAETGGAVNLNTFLPDGTAVNPSIFPGGGGTGGTGATTDRIVQAGSTVSLVQSSALTAGAATVWAELWGV
jgi:hypothetical protein